MPTAAPLTSERVQLARAAESALAACERVRATAGPGAWVTVDGARRIPGVVAIAAPAGRVELVLHADIVWPVGSLEELADELRASVAQNAAASSLGDVLGPVDVWFHDVVEAV